MIPISRQITGTALQINTAEDVMQLMEWIREQPGLCANLMARVNGTYSIELGGEDIDAVAARLGDWVIFDGDRFSVMSDEQFQAKGYETGDPQ